MQEFVRSGIPVYATEDLVRRVQGANRLIAIPKGIDVMHIHCMDYMPKVEELASNVGLPCVFTLHGRFALPLLHGQLVCVSHEIAQLQPPAADVHVIYNGVDPEEFRYRELPARKRVVIIRVCRPERCADYFMDAMDRVLGRQPNAELWIVGEDRVSTERVRYLGVRGDIAALLQGADVFAYAPRPDNGGHDLCVLEAMAVGVPPVVTNVPSVAASVSHLHDGVLVPFGQAGAFAEAVEHLIMDKRLRTTLARNARDTILKRFNIKNIARRYERLYKIAVEGNPSRFCCSPWYKARPAGGHVQILQPNIRYRRICENISPLH
jgi:glycosyltransferase involved in cell wall biosynthesis